MRKQKRYTAMKMREEASTCETVMDRAAAMLRQAADAEEENAQLKARLDAVVKELKAMREYCAFAWVDQEEVDVILRVARGEGGAE